MTLPPLRQKLPQQLVHHIKDMVQSNPTLLVQNFLVYVEERLPLGTEMPQDRDAVPSIVFEGGLFVACTATHHDFYIRFGIRHPRATLQERWLDRLQGEYRVPRNPQGKKEVLRFYHHLLMHYPLEERELTQQQVRQFLRGQGQARKKVAKVAVQTALHNTTTAPMAKWLKVALQTMRLHMG